MSTNEHILPYGQNAPATVAAALLALGAVLCALLAMQGAGLPAGIASVLLGLAAVLLPLSLFIAKQWQKAVVLRFGKLHAVRGPGLFVIVPFVDTVAAWIDQRIQTTEFNAEQALTHDTVPTKIDAILFWQVHDPERAAMEIADYHQAIL